MSKLTVRMTIYSFELETEALDRLPTVRQVISVSRTICSLIVTHLQNDIFREYPRICQRAGEENYSIQLFFTKMKSFLPYPAGDDHLVTVQDIEVVYQHDRLSPTMTHSSRGDKLAYSQINPLALLEVVARTIRCCVKILLPHLQHVPEIQRQACVDVLENSIQTLFEILREFLFSRRIVIQGISKSSFEVHLKIELADQKYDVLRLP